MGFRYYKRIKLAPGLSLNISKSGPSISIGPRGMKYTINAKGARQTLGIPGTGLYYTTTKKWHKNQASNGSSQQPVGSNFFSQLFASPQEKNFGAGLKAFIEGDSEQAKAKFIETQATDGYFMYGFIALGEKNYTVAEKYLGRCLNHLGELGSLAQKVSKDLEILLEITDYIEAPITLNKRGLGLALVEVYQQQGKYSNAIATLEGIWDENPSDKVLCLSLIDLVVQADEATAQDLKDVIEMTSTIENDGPIDTNILYLRSYGLYRLNLVQAAIKELSNLTRRKKDRPKTLLLDIRYLRGQMYEEVGQNGKAKKDYELIYAEDPHYEDVAQRLGL